MGDAKDDRTLEVSPAPWRWRDDDPGLPLCVVDARGRFMFAVDLGERIPSPGERDLIAAAPEMAALLRRLSTVAETDGAPISPFAPGGVGAEVPCVRVIIEAAEEPDGSSFTKYVYRAADARVQLPTERPPSGGGGA